MRAAPTYWLMLSGLVLLLAGCGDESTTGSALSLLKAPTSNGDNQTDTVLATLATPLRVMVLRGSAPASGITVAWTVRADTHVVSTARATTDGSGLASLTLSFGPTPSRYTILAQLSPGTGGPLVVFTATANPGLPSVLLIVSGNNQADSTKARLGADYTVQIRDSHNNNVAGVGLDWAVTAGGGSITPSHNTTAATTGYAAARHTLGPTDGPQTVTATPGGIAGAPQVTFTATAYTPADLAVTSTTTGVDPDQNGYSVTVKQGPALSKQATLSLNGSVTFRLRPGDYTVALGDVVLNCDVAPPAPPNVTLPSGGSVTVGFDVACAAASLLAFANYAGNAEIFTVKSNGTATTRLTTNSATDVEPAWSPNGNKIAFRSDRDGNDEIYVMNADGSNPTRLTSNTARDYKPAWSPDGAKIAFVSERDGNAKIYVMNADASNVVRLTADPASDSDPAWSPNGSKIAFTHAGDVYVMNADGSLATRLTTGGTDARPTWSPDGAKIAFARSSYDYYGCYYYCYTIYTINADGSAPTSFSSGTADWDPAWSPDGRWIAFAYCDDYYCYTSGIRAVRADGSRVEQISSSGGSNPAWRP